MTAAASLHRRLARHVAALALFLCVACAATYPTVLHLRTALPAEWRDQYQRTCDVELNTWILDWDARRILAGDWRGYWDGNIFHPARGVLTYSEHQLGAALLGAPVYAATRDPVLLYNVLFLLSFALCGYTAAVLVHALTGRWGPAIVAGLVFGYCPFRFGHINHLHLLTAYWTPIVLLCGHRFLERRSWSWLAGFLVALVLQCWTSLTLGTFLIILLALVALPAAIGASSHTTRRLLPAAAITVLALSATQAPIAIQYWRVHHDAGFSRTWNENMIDSADVIGYAAAPRSNRWLGGTTSHITRAERWLYPGVLACALAWLGLTSGPRPARRGQRWSWMDAAIASAIIGGIVVRAAVPVEGAGRFSWSLLAGAGAVSLMLWQIWRKAELHRFVATGRADARGFYAAWTFVAVVLSCGPVLTFANHHVGYGPYALLYTFVPGLTGLRAPVRFHLYVMLGIAVLAGYGMKQLAEAYPRWARFSLTSVVVLILVDFASVPLPAETVAALRAQAPLEQWLRAQPSEVILADLPLVPDNELWRECHSVFSSIYHHKRIVNGYSGFFPREWHWLRLETQRSGLSEAALDYLDRVGVTHVALPSGTPPPDRLQHLDDFGDRSLYAFRARRGPG